MRNHIKVLSLPSKHPYTSKFDGETISFVNPNSDLFSAGNCTPEYLNINFPVNTYDVVHIHFSFDKVGIKDLEEVLKYFKSYNKPIVWTLHSKESQRIRNYENGEYQKLLFKYSDKLISPTNGAAAWCESVFGKHIRDVSIIPLGFMANPRDIERLQENGLTKDPKLFTMLIGEFRENKEFIQSVANFLLCSDLTEFKLQLIFKPIPIVDQEGRVSQEMACFYNFLQNPRIEILSKPEISNDEINAAFLKSFALIIAYKWGTHSGQIEHARDCGCYIVASDVGFYKEQWGDVCLYKYNENNPLETAKAYTTALIEVSKRDVSRPLGMERLKEHKKIIAQHLEVYNDLLAEFGK